MRSLIAPGGNAIKQADEKGSTKEQFANCEKKSKGYSTNIEANERG